jgi:hypothetical protein
MNRQVLLLDEYPRCVSRSPVFTNRRGGTLARAESENAGWAFAANATPTRSAPLNNLHVRIEPNANDQYSKH